MTTEELLNSPGWYSIGARTGRRPDVEQLIEAALAHAKHLRESANGADDYGARVTEEGAERWERLASAAQDELSALHRD
jgi:hypothetical protein